jgi:hypothetical protein
MVNYLCVTCVTGIDVMARFISSNNTIIYGNCDDSDK